MSDPLFDVLNEIDCHDNYYTREDEMTVSQPALKCNICGTLFQPPNAGRNIQAHFALAHEGGDLMPVSHPMLECGFCDKPCHGREALNDHLLLKHPGSLKVPSVKEFGELVSEVNRLSRNMGIYDISNLCGMLLDIQEKVDAMAERQQRMNNALLDHKSKINQIIDRLSGQTDEYAPKGVPPPGSERKEGRR